jgi:hypothetical protein
MLYPAELRRPVQQLYDTTLSGSCQETIDSDGSQKSFKDSAIRD